MDFDFVTLIKEEVIFVMNRLSEKYIEQVGDAWNCKNNVELRSSWWNSEQIIRHMNYIICGEKLEGWNAGAIKQLKKICGKYERAVSIGCGMGNKEMQLLEQGVVDEFICFELSDERIRLGKEQAKSRGLEGRIKFYKQDFFFSDWKNEKFDLVFWDNSLHHMLDTYEAVKVSKEILNENGVFFCNDYIGESRFQWSDKKLDYVNKLRDGLDDNIFHVGSEIFPRHRKRPSLESMIQSDPSEAADSENILPAIRKQFKNPMIKMLGGTVYLLLLDRMIQNIPENSELLQKLIEADDAAIKEGMSMYAFILAKKNDEIIKEF